MYQGIQCYPEYLVYYERVLEHEESLLTPSHITDHETLSEAKVLTEEERLVVDLLQQRDVLQEESLQTQISLLELENLNDWYTFQINEQEKRIKELKGLSQKAKIHCCTLTFTVPEQERAFRVAHMRTLSFLVFITSAHDILYQPIPLPSP